MLATFDIGTMMSQENQIKNIPISSLVPYHDHKFQLYSGERLEDMIESVKKNGYTDSYNCTALWERIMKFSPVITAQMRKACRT